jgi:predicted Rossmann fold nucleotide-binding protein DprA/Smf involved in DNA uptake
MPQRVDDLVHKTGLAAGDIGAALTMMELQGGARNMGGGEWVKG